MFLTANRVEVGLEDAVETLALADLYGISRLRTACLLLVRSRIDVDSAIPMLLQADQVHLQPGSSRCASVLCALCYGSGWVSFVQSYPLPPLPIPTRGGKCEVSAR